MALFYDDGNTLTLAVCTGNVARTINHRIRDDHLLDGSFVDVVIAINVNSASYLLVDGEHVTTTVGLDWSGSGGYKLLEGGGVHCGVSTDHVPVAFSSGELDLDVGWQVYYNRGYTPASPQNLGGPSGRLPIALRHQLVFRRVRAEWRRDLRGGAQHACLRVQQRMDGQLLHPSGGHNTYSQLLHARLPIGNRCTPYHP